MFKFPSDISGYLQKNPVFEDYVKKNRGDERYVRCEFPQLMGWNALRRPEWLSRSLKYPYFDKPYGIQARTQERLMRPHVNRVKFYRDSDETHSILKKADIFLDDKNQTQMPWGEVRVGNWKKNNNLPVLVKIFDKSKPEWESEDALLALETCKSQSIGHVNFVHYYGCLENKLMKYHIFEHLSRGTLLEVLRAESAVKISDDILRKMFCQVLFAVSHLHDKDMVHRNLKLENILVSEYYDIRLQGLSFLEKTTAQNRGDPQTISRTKFSLDYGPKKYRSPERMKGIAFNPLLDQVWCLGVILYSMFHRKFPFTFPEGDKEQIDKVLEHGTLYPRVSYPPGLVPLFDAIFSPEERRPRTWELFDFDWVNGDPDTPSMKKANAIGRYTHEKAKAILNEKARMLKIRKQLFKRYRMFRTDMLRQPNYQVAEMRRAEGMLDTAEGLFGHKPFLQHELPYNFTTLHEYEKLHKNEYWPSLFQFNPIKCKHLGIRRLYCNINPDPKDMVGNLLKLQDKRVKQYPVPPHKNDPPKRPPLNLEYLDIDDYKL
ncbi:Testis-specific serine/threonine-protein kinase 2 [Orchesella cincta]|uniref:Testis-specific serine/threonine-protein kinase 2 n=1 Tax=Orchesella cincta TaxID=48709 RepID=A0A1D2MZX9_ORCCI|nr:Testis-specific serine/threonine-protein kinase 2 [Orchesella cincta]